MTSSPRRAVTNVDLARTAEDLRVRLTHHDEGPKGFYDHARRTISTRRGLSIAAYKSTLAHELGHAYYGDTACRDPVLRARQEHRADQWAATFLIRNADEVLELATAYEHPASVAHELEITPHLLTVWAQQQNDLET